jgi:hypothetical protein
MLILIVSRVMNRNASIMFKTSVHAAEVTSTVLLNRYVWLCYVTTSSCKIEMNTKIDDLTKIGYSAMLVLPVDHTQCMLNSKHIYILL